MILRMFTRHSCADNLTWCEDCLDDKQRAKIIDIYGDPIARECEGCNAEPYEQCREGCLSTSI